MAVLFTNLEHQKNLFTCWLSYCYSFKYGNAYSHGSSLLLTSSEEWASTGTIEILAVSIVCSHMTNQDSQAQFWEQTQPWLGHGQIDSFLSNVGPCKNLAETVGVQELQLGFPNSLLQSLKATY